MSFADAVKSCFSQYTGFSGRARRSEYWYWYLFTGLVSIVLSALAQFTTQYITLLSLAILLPTIAVEIRRLHDIGKSGWFILLNLIPCIGQIILIVFCVQDSQPGENQYGPNPKGM
ncbi:MAG: DUF805 domain-containing protein [Lachnospiraceae bacterium]|nr:DUF805 domain-containing protein [Lachnospiraceae bacterium]MBR1523744.1 DUF805 domain-containing protein [Lachnospiraceae bacterium]